MRIKSIVLPVLLFLSTAAAAETITLKQTLDKLITNTTRGRLIAGQREVSQAKFRAERVGYFLPEISLNASGPTYQESEDYDTYPGFFDPIFFKRTNVFGGGNLRLKQKIITGGDLTFETQLNLRNDEYPNALYVDEVINDTLTIRKLVGFSTATDKRRLGNFYLQFSQPLFQTSSSRSAYREARDNLSKADIEWQVNRADLRKEGITAFFDLLTAEVDQEEAENNSQLANYNAKWDSVKFDDGVINEEAWIECKSERLEKKLGFFDAQATFEEKQNEFSHLLDLAGGSSPELEIPPTPMLPDINREKWLLENASKSSEAALAHVNMDIAERELSKTQTNAGINGTLNASYAVGRGTVTRTADEEVEDKINTKDWRVSVDFNYPIWDGGASGANVHSMELAYETARLEYVSAERSARSKMTILLRRLEINHSKLSLLEQELDLAETKLEDAKDRHLQGLISDGTLLENKVYYLEAQKNRLTTLKDYYLDLAELEKTELP
ncbi:MAG: TolC family protein [FCB group bacterium]|nr:TolC family protein [FCB group bacterium]